MSTAATATPIRPIQTQAVTPAPDRTEAALRPTETRYGWCPFGDINLVGADGTINLLVQPAELLANGQAVANPYHRVLPKNQLIPFPTFNYQELSPSSDRRDSQGRAVLERATHTMTAYDAAVSVLQRYAGWGFTILDSLQGLEQDKAFRIFQVVMPLDYLIKDLGIELGMGAEQRINSTEPITFSAIPGYVVEPLRDESEREIAVKLAAEMTVGADAAFILASEIFDKTETSMVSKFGGGKGKNGPDALDRRLSAELGRALPQLIGDAKQTAVEAKLDMLVDHAVSQQMKDQLRELQEENARLRAGASSGLDATTMMASVPETVEEPEAEPPAPVAAPQGSICGVTKDNGEPCRIVTKGGPCGLHKNQVEE